MKQIHHLNISINDNSHHWLRYLPGAERGSELCADIWPSHIWEEISVSRYKVLHASSQCVLQAASGLDSGTAVEKKANLPLPAPHWAPISAYTQMPHAVQWRAGGRDIPVQQEGRRRETREHNDKP